MSKFHTITIIVVGIIAVAMGALMASFPDSFIKVVGYASGWILLCVKVLYEKWDKFFMTIQKFKYKFFGLDTLWSLTVKYELETNEDVILLVRKTLLSCELKDLKISQPFDHILVVRSEGMTWEFIDDDGDLEVHLFDINVTYSKADKLITKIISPCFQLIENKLNIHKKHYFLSVTFENNPFIGLYMSKIAGKDLVNFDITFKLEDNRVEVHKDKIIIQTDSITDLTEISKDVLAISPQ